MLHCILLRTKLSLHLSVVLLSTLALTGLLVGCNGERPTTGSVLNPLSQAATTNITITTKDFSFEMPTSIPAGMVDIKLVNIGKDLHHAMLTRLNEGVTLQKLQGEMQRDPNSVLSLTTFTGGANTVPPGESQEVILNMAPGQYMAFCFVEGQDHKAHVEKGMVKPFTVTEHSGWQNAQSPAANGEVTLKDYSFTFPSPFRSGPTTLKVTNQGPQVHELTLVKIAQGKTIGDVRTFMQTQSPAGPPPFTAVGGMGALAPNASGWAKLDLAPGKYAAVCLVPEMKTGKPHTMLGMIQPFTIE